MSRKAPAGPGPDGATQAVSSMQAGVTRVNDGVNLARQAGESIGEIRRGIERLPDGKRKLQLQKWLQSLCDCMQGRILGFNTSTAHVWGQLKAKWESAGVNVPSLDSQIAATASRHSLVLVTRNTDDFEKTGIKMLNPFV